mmetsp:Transcript_20277/g.65326  ORF Transcript_20277/g.65326 Transcript_20277/m.65326 type:complete len:270 (-) Transcript_20277:1150-1959(-)
MMPLRRKNVPSSTKKSKEKQPPRLSVIIPAHNESAAIGRTVEKVRSAARDPVEIVLVDGGSTDATIEVARPSVDVVLRAAGGRGQALVAGADAATGDYLLFLHADTLVPPDFDVALCHALEDPKTLLCAFTLRFDDSDNDDILLDLVASAANFRARFLHLPFGDQGLALTRTSLEALGGVRPIPILEDVDLVLRARKHARKTRQRVALLAPQVRTSPRRYLHSGLLKANVLNALLLLWWQLGATPEAIFATYYGAAAAAPPGAAGEKTK